MNLFFRLSRGTGIIAILLANVFTPGAIYAEPIVGLTTDDAIITFESDAPDTVITRTAVTGLQTGERLLAFDFRPANGTLYALGSSSRLYTLNLNTGVASQVGTSVFSTVLDGTDFGFDFNPTVDRIRVVSDSGQNIRLNPDTGAIAGTDTSLAYANGDLNQGATPNVVALAYNNNFVGASKTTVFGIDATLDALVTVGTAFGATSPNTGQLSTVGSLALDSTSNIGFDISHLTGDAYVSLTSSGQTASALYDIDFGTGLGMARLGSISSGELTKDIAIPLLDVTDPTVIVTSPSSLSRTVTRKTATLTGTASDNLLVTAVRYRALNSSGGGTFKTATGTANWSIALSNLKIGTTRVQIKSVDLHGNESAVTTVSIRRRR